MHEARGCSLGFVGGRHTGTRRRFDTYENTAYEMIVPWSLITTYTAISSYTDCVASYLVEIFKVSD
jgi:hypothetical protein